MKRILLFFLLLSPLFVTAQESVESLYSQASKYYEAKDHEKAYPLMLQAAEQGYYKAECVIGHYYFFGYSPLEQNYAKAFEWYKKASDHGSISAKQKLGYMYHAGLYVSANKEKAYQYYIDAAQKGDAYSSINLGYIYLDEYGAFRGEAYYADFPPVDKNKAYANVPNYGYNVGSRTVVSSKPAPGEANTQYEEKPAPPARLYEDTNYRVPVIDSMGHLNLDVIPMSPAEEWFLLAAKQDSTDGLFYLAVFYEDMHDAFDPKHFRGIDINLPDKTIYDNGIRLYEMAAKNGSAKAQAVIGEQYMQSHQFPTALKWLEMAKKKGAKDIYRGEWYYYYNRDTPSVVDEAIAVCKHFLKKQPYTYYGVVWWDYENDEYIHSDLYVYVQVKNDQEKEGLIKIDMKGRLISKTPIKFDENNSLYEHIKIENGQLLFDGQPF